VCAAAGDRFEPVAQEEASGQQSGDGYRVVIVGAGIAGVSAAEAVRKSAPTAEIVLISKEPCLPYYRLNLTRYLAGEVTAAQLDLHPAAWYSDREIQLMLNADVRGIDLAAKRLTLEGASTV
jgi:nitrite reductase (NADH) large subunit